MEAHQILWQCGTNWLGLAICDHEDLDNHHDYDDDDDDDDDDENNDEGAEDVEDDEDEMRMDEDGDCHGDDDGDGACTQVCSFSLSRFILLLFHLCRR